MNDRGGTRTHDHTREGEDFSLPNRTCDFHRIRLSSGYSQRPFTITDFAHLRPFPVYQALPWSFEYYGPSVTLHLAMCR